MNFTLKISYKEFLNSVNTDINELLKDEYTVNYEIEIDVNGKLDLTFNMLKSNIN